MASLKEKAQEYEPKLTRNISELPTVPVIAEIMQGHGIDKKGVEFSYNFICFNGEEYRVPDSVLKALKEILATRPEITHIKVNKTGEGLNSSYTVIPL